MSEHRRPDYRVKVYANREDRYGCEVGAAWDLSGGGIRVVLRAGLAVHGSLVLWPEERTEDRSAGGDDRGQTSAQQPSNRGGVPF